MRESESGTLPRAKVWYGAKPNNRVSQQTQAKSEMLAKGELCTLTFLPFQKMCTLDMYVVCLVKYFKLTI